MQLSVNAAGQPLAIAGLKFDNMEGTDVVSMFNVGTLSVPFGCGVAQDASGDQATRLPSATTDTVVGVSLYGMNHVPNYTPPGATIGSGDLDSVGLITGAGLQVMRRGRVWVLVETAVVVNDRAYCRAVANAGAGFNQLGSWRNSADGTNTIDVRRVAVFRTAASAGGLAVLEVDFTISPTI